MGDVRRLTFNQIANVMDALVDRLRAAG